MGSDLIVCRVILILLLIKSTTCESDRLDQDACQTFISSKQVKDLIEVKRRLIPSCPCLKQQIDLDYSYEKVGHCYRSWNFEDGVKMMCCYSSDGNLFVGAPHGGYMLFEDRWRNMDDIRRSCCLEDHTCQQFYEINPSDDCSSYIPPVTVTSFGDPNIETIDGNKFDFNGHGEYVFLKTSDLEIQVRLGYVTPGNNDSTLFEAFAIFDTTSKETFEVYFNRSTKKLSVYKNATIICNSVLKGPLQPCQKPEKDHCMIQTDGNKIAIIGCGFRSFASQIVFTSGKLMDVSMTKYSSKTPINITGLAGHQHDGKFIFRNGTGVETNSTRILFDYGESWSLVNESESLFNYSLTGGNFTFYNNPHSRPRFLEDLVGNLTALFQGYPEANISLINETCRNDWDNETNEECLLTVARTKQFNLGVAVMETVNEEHRVWEILHNKPPYFLGNMTDNITAVYKQDANITIDLKQYVGDDQPVDTLRFHVETQLPAEEFSLDEGVFIWNVGTGLRYIDTSLTFFVNDSLNASAKHDVTINYCGCEKPSECEFNTENSNSSTRVKKAGCDCPEYFSGLYCEVQLDACNDTKCYEKCNMTFERSSPSWPCAPCPKGREEKMIPKEQKCNDIDECAEGYSGRDKCEHICTDIDGSFNCSCRNGYKLNSNKYSCDDIDECSNGAGICTEEHTYCQNTKGSYVCLCVPGYDNSTGTCKKNEGQKYVGSMTIKIMYAQEKVNSLNKTVDTKDNRNKIQKKLEKCFNGTEGYQSVEVLSIMIISINRERRDAEQKEYHLKADYVVTWAKNTTVDDSASRKLEQSFQKNNQDEILDLGDVKINLKTASLDVKSGNDNGLCSVPNLITCDLTSTNCTEVPGGSFKCECRQGFVPRGSNDYCADAIECQDSNSQQCSNGKCRDTYGGFTCDCHNGFSLNKTDERNPFCQDIDECEEYDCVDGQCQNREGGWDCSCNGTGFIRKEIHNGFICYDIDECSNSSYICKDGVCKNNDGDWSCTCAPGYIKQNKSATHIECIEIDECDQFLKNGTNEERCVHGTCENKPGTWVCNCPRNRTLQSVGNKSYAMYRCQGDYQYIGQLILFWKKSASVSIESVETFVNKTIKELFLEKYNDSITPTKGQPSMRDIFLSVDFLNATFENIYEAYVMTNVSYVLHLGEAVSSEWVNEIQSKLFNQTTDFTSSAGVSVSVFTSTILNEKGINLCNIPDKTKCDLKSTVCNVHNGSFSCDCKPGFSRNDDHRCEDIDECKLEQDVHTCSNGGTCDNTDGNWTCECPQGYTPLYMNETFINCTDIDECKLEQDVHTCSNEGTCDNTDGNWTCKCPQGYAPLYLNESLINCTDIDECKRDQGLHTCSNGGTCDNTDGNWTCECPQGYTPLYMNETFINCTDIDECYQTQGSHTCSNGGTCVNKEGNWTCECPQGYIPDYINETFINCNDINECETPNISCIDADKCENTIGNWSCICGKGQKEKTINETSKVCAGEYQYVASVSFTMPATDNHRSDNKSLVAAITNHILNMYKNTIKDSKVWVEILTITYSTLRRKRSSQSSEQIKAKYIVHFDRSVKEDELEKVDDEFVNTSIQVDNVTLTMESNGIQREIINAICDTKNNDCDTKTSTCHSTTGKIECECKEGFKKEDSGSCFAERTDSKDNDQTTVIAVASSLSGLVVILSGVIFGVLRWKRKKIKEAEKIVKRHESDLQDFNDSYLASQYMRGSRSDVGSLHDLRFSNIAIPRVKHNGDARSLNGHVPGNLYSFPQKPPKPHYKGSLPDLTNVIVYPSHNRRLSDQYPGRYFNHEKADFTRSHDAINDSGRYSPILDYRRQGAPKPDYDRFQENRFSGQKISYINGNDRPRSPKPDYGRFDGNRRSRSPNPNYRWDDRQERSNDSGVGNGYSSDSNDYRRTEQRGGYRYSDTRF